MNNNDVFETMSYHPNMIMYNNPEFVEETIIEKISYMQIVMDIIKYIMEVSKKHCEPDY
jgi:hypothetical protein